MKKIKKWYNKKIKKPALITLEGLEKFADSLNFKKIKEEKDRRKDGKK